MIRVMYFENPANRLSEAFIKFAYDALTAYLGHACLYISAAVLQHAPAIIAAESTFGPDTPPVVTDF